MVLQFVDNAVAPPFAPKTLCYTPKYLFKKGYYACFEVFMESDNIAKFQKIVAGLAPEKRRELYARMKGMSRE